MSTITRSGLVWFFVTASLAIAATGNVLRHSKILERLESEVVTLPREEGLQGAGLLSAEPNEFPFKIEGSRFVRKSDGKPVFLNIIGYQPLEPGKKPWDENYPEREQISSYRLKDDLRRLKAFQGGSEPVVLRVYTQPTPREPNRLPKFFYNDIRELGFWIIRDIYFDNIDFDEGKAKVDMVISEVNNANAFDVIFAWEIGNEFKVGADGSADEIETFIENICAYIKDEVNEVDIEGISDWVTWQSWVGSDPLWTDYEYTIPIEPEGLDYISFNAYCYEPAQIRDHQPGPTTGTPYQGYLAALKGHYSDKPFVIVETGLSDSNLPEPDAGHVHERLQPWYPAYRKGGLTSEQVAEGLADRYWDARLLRDESDPNIVIAGLAIFEWNDEWWKAGTPGEDDQLPEEHFGLGRFEERLGGEGYQLRYKLQQETIRDLYTLKFMNDPATLEAVAANSNILPAGASIEIDTAMSGEMAGPMRYRWEANRGHIVGDGASAEFYPAENVLGPARITTVSIDGDNYATVSSSKINIEPSEPNSIEILTVGTGVDLSDPSVKASGRISNVNLDEYKLVCYIYNWHFYIQPYGAMKSIWIGPDGYWWTKITNARDNPGELYCWLVPKSWDPPNEVADPHWAPPEYIAEANTVSMDVNDYNDVDNDLLPDYWEKQYFNSIDVNDRYDDPDGDGANNLEEFLAGTSMVDENDNDSDGDGLPDNWERHFFGDISFYDGGNDPDGDELTNSQEQDPNVGTHPGRASQDSDQDGLPDPWEIRWFGNCDANPHENPDGDCLDNLDEYELGSDPTISVGDFNCDWIVDMNDLDIFGSAWLSNPNDTNWNPACDIFKPNDNFINFLDFAVFAKNWLLGL